MIAHVRSRLAPHALAQENGAAMIIAVMTLFVIMILVTAAVAVSTSANSSTRQDSNRKNASEAAEAGLQIAVYRLNMLNPSSQNCVGDAASAPGSNGVCQSSVYTLGNGSTYQYYMTPVLGSSSTCVGVQITSDDVNQRCITAVGVSNGVTERSQIRAAAFAAQPLFPVHGIIGLSSVTLNGNAAVVGSAGTNGPATLNGNSTSSGVVLGPAGTYSHSGNASGGTVTNLSSPIVLSPVNPGTSNQSSLSNCPARQSAGYPACNDNYRITNGLASPPVTPYDQSSGISWTPSTRSLSLTTNASLTLGGGLYNFCSLSMAGNASITIAANVQAEVFIDSPDDPGSGCPAGSGNLSMSGNASWNNLSQNPLALQLYIYGLNNGSSAVSLTGNANFYGVVYAPQSAVTLSGNGSVVGAVAGKSATISGNGFNYDTRVNTLQANTNGLYYRTAWAQCSPVLQSSSPGSGCG